MTTPASGARERPRLLLVHAHPDDESINNGATMARYAAGGARVTLVTCTRGELGEIIVAGLEHLAADREDALGAYRETELAAAMAELGVTDHRFLAPPGVYRDSGMAGLPENSAPNAFWQADTDEAAARLAAIIREVRPHVLVTYDENGGYGHPDHVKAHRVAMRAAELAAPEHGIAKIYWNALPREEVLRADAALRASGARHRFRTPDDDPYSTDGAPVSAVVEASDHLARKIAAMRAHATQIQVDGGYFALSNGIAQPVMATEYYLLARGEPGPCGADGLEHDLFAGLAGLAPLAPAAPSHGGHR
jgi:N-acetyl-1-D-myo-inositol-2-amino-2-deoxy-alpha-D-glucopyranoside deacetylase